MSSDEEVICVRKKKFVVADSSDENETDDKSDVKFNHKDSDHDESEGSGYHEKNLIEKHRRIKTYDSSSDGEDNILKSLEDKKTKIFKKSKNKNIAFQNGTKSDDGSSSEDREPENTEREKHVGTSGEGSKTVFQNQWYKNSDLYDAEESSEEDPERVESKGTSENESNDLSVARAVLEESSKQRHSKNHHQRPSKREERKSKKKAQEDIKTDIHRESQRLMRQAPISIPYHRPKQRSLAEFLVRRKSTPKVPLQASSEQLVTAMIEIEQREREVELFYKSESSEDENELIKEENKSETNAADEGFDEITKDMLKAEQALESNATIHTANQETSCVKLKYSSDSEKSDCQDFNLDSSCKKRENSSKVDSIFTIENNKSENSEKENLFENHVVDNLNNSKELKILADEYCCNNSETQIEIKENTPDNFGPLSESPEVHLEEKVGKPENITTGHFSPSQIAEHSQNEIAGDKSLQSVGNRQSNGTSESVVNTEEFSLKLSESQSELESTENCSSQNPTSSKNGESLDPNTGKELNIVDKLKVLEDQDYITFKENHKQNNSEPNVKESRKLGLTHEESNEEIELFKKYNVDTKNATVSTPKIIGSHDEVIDLDDGIPKPEVNQLMKRFLTHISYKKKPKKKVAVELSVVSAERDAAGQVSAISEESLLVVVGEGEEEEEDPSLARPGAKLMRLRAQLQQQMERQREREWAQRQQQQRLYEDEEIFEGEKDVCDELEEEGGFEKSSNVGNNDEDEEEEEDDEEEEESESEDDETDEEVAEEKRKSRSVFLDDEAEETDEEPFSTNNCKSKEDNKDNNYSDDDHVEDCNESSVDIDLNDKDQSKEKDVEINNKNPKKEENTTGSKTISDFFIKRPLKMKPCLPRTRTASDMFATEDIISCTPDEEELPSFQKPRSVDDKEDVEDKPLETPPIISPAFQLTGLENMDLTNKYNWSAPSTPCKDFFSPKIVTPVQAIPNLVDKSPLVGTQDLENMCSGNFTSQPLLEMEENVQDLDLFLADESQLSREHVTPLKDTSAGKMNSMETLPGDDEAEPAPKFPTKKAKKLNFSDDEDDGDEYGKAHEEAKADGSNEEGSDAEGEVEYDSEENEVLLERGEAAAAGEFLDVEAELSEEEWSSEDEDERGLDALETEEADRENIDQRKLKRQLDQIHLREVLKEDKRQVKLLQEMLLEDGELHSENKRQRLFRWSNNAAFEEGDNKAVLDSDEEKGEEDEDEENWRKSRHERELFLQEHSKKVEKLETLEIEDSDSQLLKLGQKALKRLSSNSQEPRLTPPTLSNPLASPDAKKTFVLPKRGSFLGRGQQTLSRLAQMVSSTSEGPIQQPKNSRNFVFTSISPTKSGEQEEAKSSLVPNKRKMPHLPLPIAKKPCAPKSKTVNKKSLFEALTRGHS